MIQKLVVSLSIYRGLPRNIYFLALARIILGLGNFIIPFLVLLLTDKLGYSATAAGTWAMGITATYFLGGLIGGKLSDVWGHKSVMVTGELLGSGVILACGWVAQAPILVPIGLVIAYFFIGIAVPASNALVADFSQPHNRDAIMSLSYLAYNFGSAVGPIIAGYLFWHHTQWIFFGNGGAVLCGIVIVALFINVPSETSECHISELERPVEGSVWRVLKARPRLLVFTFLCGLLWYALNQMTMMSPLYLSALYDEQGPLIFGQLMTFACIAVVILTPLLMRLTRHQIETISLAYAGGLFMLGYGVIVLWPTIPAHFIAWLFLSAGEVLLLTKEGIYLANHSPASHRGRIQGVLVTLRSVLVMPSFMVIGFLIDRFGYHTTWLSIIAVALIAMFGFYVMSHQSRARSQRVDEGVSK